MKTELTYLVSAYSHSDPAVRQRRFEYVSEVAAGLISNGICVFSPIAHTHPIAVSGKLATGYEFWRNYDELLMSKCSHMAIVVMDGIATSKGAHAEILWWLRNCGRNTIGIVDTITSRVLYDRKITANLIKCVLNDTPDEEVARLLQAVSL